MFAKTENNQVLICAIQLDESWIEVTKSPESKDYRDTWVLKGSVISENAKQKKAIVLLNTTEASKINGVMFDNVLCSATKRDADGILAAERWVNSGNNTSFNFENGNSLALTPSNIEEFCEVWYTFRQSLLN